MTDSLLVQVADALQDLSVESLGGLLVVGPIVRDLVEDLGAIDEFNYLVNYRFELVLEHLDTPDHIFVIQSTQNLKFFFVSH